MKKYLHKKKDCIKKQLEDEHIVIIQLDHLTLPVEKMTFSHNRPITPENKIPT